MAWATPSTNAKTAALAVFFKVLAEARSSKKWSFGRRRSVLHREAWHALLVSATRQLCGGLKKANSLPDIVETLLPAKKSDVLELDEMWSFVYAKCFKRWIWVALCRRTRQIVSYFIGDRGVESCRAFWKLIPKVYRRCVSFSDFWGAYQEVITSGKHHMIGKESGETNHIERWNNTLRQRICRFVRKTLSFSKSDEMHQAYLHLFVFNYNTSLTK